MVAGLPAGGAGGGVTARRLPGPGTGGETPCRLGLWVGRPSRAWRLPGRATGLTLPARTPGAPARLQELPMGLRVRCRGWKQ